MVSVEPTGQPHFTAVVLAGGHSRRMGQDKAMMLIGGEALLTRMVHRLQHATPDLLVVGPSMFAPLIPGVPLICDDTPDLGPLGGLATALRHTTIPRAFVVACDMPFLAPQLVMAMAHLAEQSPDAQVVALRGDKGWEPLHAIYASSCLPVIEQQLAAGERSLHRLLDHIIVREMPDEEVASYDPRRLSTFNANTPKDWRRALQLAETEEETSTAGAGIEKPAFHMEGGPGVE